MEIYLTAYFGTMLLAILLVPIVSRLAKRYRLMDAPGPRKMHQTPLPRIGGIALAVATLALVVPVFFTVNDISRSLGGGRTRFLVLLAAGSSVFIVGLIDDLRSLPGYVKLFCLVAASLAICASGATLRSVSVGELFEFETGWAAWPLTLLWITAIAVCMNLIDGLDGLAAGIAAIVCGTIALSAFLSGQAAMVVLMLAMLGSVTGFLFFNFYPAKIFMGDCGSLFLGFMIGAGSVVCHAKTPTFVGLALPFLALGVPILDAGIAVVRRRTVERRSIFAADRKHLHHRLLDLGLNQRTAVIVIYAFTGISASIGVFMLTAGDGWSVGLFGIGLLLLLAIFGCLHGGRCCEIVMALRRNRAIMHEARAARHDFENAEVEMRNAKSFGARWDAVCGMAGQMHFQSIGLRKRHDDDFVVIRAWNAPGRTFAGGKTMELSFPLHGDSTDWEIRADIEVNGFLELSGQQAMLLARLMDGFPPLPAGETEALDAHNEHVKSRGLPDYSSERKSMDGLQQADQAY